jgi:hypothetical protein
VFSGNKSLHFHFIFSTEHLQNVPFGAVAGDRLADFRRASAILHNVHNRYWDHVDEGFVRILKPSMPADRKLRSLTQWRRAPWGIRSPDDDSLLGLRTPVPQLVLRERILPRAPRGNAGFQVPESFCLADPLRTIRRRTEGVGGIAEFDEPSVVDLAAEICSAEWGEWPRPAGVNIQNGEWLFRFRNHQYDRNPSSIVLGDHRRLQLCGRHGFGERQFFLPDQMTAQELGNHLAERLGWQPLEDHSRSRRLPSLQAQEIQPPGFQDFSQPDRVVVQGEVADREAAKQAYRDLLRRQMAPERRWHRVNRHVGGRHRQDHCLSSDACRSGPGGRHGPQ